MWSLFCKKKKKGKFSVIGVTFNKPFVKRWLRQQCAYKKLWHNKKTLSIMAINQKALDKGDGSKEEEKIKSPPNNDSATLL